MTIWEERKKRTAGVKCQDATLGTDEGCVGATPGMTSHCDSPYGRSPCCVVLLCVCLFVWVCLCVPGGNGANSLDTQLL